MFDKTDNRRELYPKLKTAAQHRSPGQCHRQMILVASISVGKHADDHNYVVDDRCGIREKEFPVAIQNSQTPRGKDQQGDTGKKDADQVYCKLALLSLKSGCDEIDQ